MLIKHNKNDQICDETAAWYIFIKVKVEPKNLCILVLH
jgi:esterase/lipase